jgi:tetratricopeptide (TPR) repeat protein
MKGDDWTTLSAYGVALDQTGSHATAREMYQAALTLSPNNAVVESNLAMSMMLDGRIDQAETTFRRLVARPDATAQMRQNLAMVEALKGNVVEAEQLAREDLPASEATNNMAVLRQLDARNAKINVQDLPPPAPEAPAKTSVAPAAAPAIVATETPTPESAEAALAPVAKEPAKQKAPAYMMAPIADEGDPLAPAAVAAQAEKSAQAAPAPQADTVATPPAKPAPETKPIASNQATGKPTPVLRKTYDVYRRSSAVSVANAQQ